MLIRVLAIYFLLVSNLVFAQSTDADLSVIDVDSSLIKIEQELNSLGKIVIEDSLLINRQNANAKFTTLLEEALQSPNAYHYPFDSLITVSKLKSPDDSFRIFTWQLFEDDDSYFYSGILLKKDGTLISLSDQSNNYFTPEFEVGDKDHWYGALYYKLMPFQGEGGLTYYLLFGFDGNALMERRKLIDVLSFDEDGQLRFGAPVFLAGNESKSHPAVMNRVILEYFAGASINCNYDEVQNQILFEHLIFKKTSLGEFLIPDGSYEGYVYEEGKWRHNAKVFHEVLDAPPFPNPKTKEDGKKDMFGKEQKRATVNPNRSKKANKGVRERNKKRREAKKKEEEAKKKN